MTLAEPLKSNIPEFSVSDLAFSLRRTLEENYSRVRVRGEFGRIMIASSGHMYATLKDNQANIDAVCWKGTLSKLTIKPEEGLEVICTGKISSYPASSKYQLIIDAIEFAGEGALLKMLEERRKKLAAEGLFASERKKPIPFLPDTIGVVTSPTGAVIRDILHRLNDRFPRHVLVWPVLVQGEAAAAQVANAIRGFNNLPQNIKPDVLIVARGGGSLEDLMPFNEEIVVRAAAESQIPLISAVGHETDTTLIDYAADLRAPTPTGAAEMAVPVRMNLLTQIAADEKRLLSGITRLLSESRHRLDAAASKLGDPLRLIEFKMQKLDHTAERMAGTFHRFLMRKQEHLMTLSTNFRPPEMKLSRAQQTLSAISEKLETSVRDHFRNKAIRIENLNNMLEALSFENVLQRGFAVVRSEQGEVLTNPELLKPDQNIVLQFKEKKFFGATILKNAKNLSEE